METDRHWMEKAVAQARMSRSEPGRISPLVGAVAVDKNGTFQGEAHRGEDEHHGDHAEFYLLHKKLNTAVLANSTIFTTLEPCFERGYGKVPCAHRLVERRVARVVIGMLDPDPWVHGKGQMFLLENGINVQNFEADLTKEIMEMNRDFIRDRKTARFVITSHNHNSSVDRGDIIVTGKYNPRVSDERYAVFTRRGREYWPQGRFVMHHNGTWECIITTTDRLGELDIVVAQVSADVSLWIRYYSKIGNKKNIWMGLDIENLPDGIKVNHQITLNIV
jgi:pyrimidine deaminase RibD-like protein